MRRILFDDPGMPPYAITAERTSIGRDRDNDVVLAHASVSRHHARIVGTSEALLLSDLDSANGTFVNGRPVTDHRIGPGDRLRFGDVCCRLDGDRAVAADDVLDDDEKLRPVRDHFAGAFHILRELGAGQQAVVYEAEQLADRARIALKVLRARLTSDGEARFRREVKMLGALRHPGIVRLVDAGHVGGIPYFATELVAGGSLALKLEGGRRVTALEASTLAVQIAAALDHAHATGIVHRDLKPANVLLAGTTAPETRLADFGIAKLIEATTLTESGAILGTPGFMCPEQIQGREPSPAWDVYALGATLYVATTGKHPGLSPSPLDHLRPDVPAVLARIVGDCLAWTPASRPTPGDIVSALEKEG